LKLVLITVECKGLPPRSADSRTWCLETNWRVKAQFAERIRMASRVGPHFRSAASRVPRQILKPRSLDFDPDASVGIRPSFEPKLLFALLAFKLCWKSTNRNALTSVCRRLNTPIGVSILSQPVEGILQAFDGIDMAPVKSP